MLRILIAGVAVLMVAGCAYSAAPGPVRQTVSAENKPLNKTQSTAVTKAVKDRLKDPGSATFRNLRMVNSATGAFCGEVNAKNSYGGYTGFVPFTGIITKDGKTAVVASELSAQQTNMIVVNEMCARPLA